MPCFWSIWSTLLLNCLKNVHKFLHSLHFKAGFPHQRSFLLEKNIWAQNDGGELWPFPGALIMQDKQTIWLAQLVAEPSLGPDLDRVHQLVMPDGNSYLHSGLCASKNCLQNIFMSSALHMFPAQEVCTLNVSLKWCKGPRVHQPGQIKVTSTAIRV